MLFRHHKCTLLTLCTLFAMMEVSGETIDMLMEQAATVRKEWSAGCDNVINMKEKIKQDNNKTTKTEKSVCQACIWFDRYEIMEMLGEGGTGRVYLARDMRLGRPVAVKILEQVTERFQEEVALLQKQSLWMLPAVFDAWIEEDHTGVIVMEYVEGQNLKEYLVLHRQIGERQIYDWGLQLGEFLKQLHGRNPKVLYRDLKPENIMVQPDKTLRLVDVGAAVRLGEEKLYQRKRVGTFGYAAPEQWEGKAVDERADIYGLGAVLYAMMAGEEKLKNRTGMENPGMENSGMPEGMVRAVRRCLCRDKEKRYATAEAFAADWKRYKSVGKGKAFVMRAEKILACFFLYAAVYIVWYRAESLALAGRFIAGYLWLKAAEWIFHKQNERWEQKKSVWCRGLECDKV